MSTEQSFITNTQGLTTLDRSIVIVLPNPDGTASRKRKISSRTERLHRLHGTSILLEVSRLLGLGPSTYATACSIFHRFYHQSSLDEFDVWSIAMASLLLSTKVEEESQPLITIIHGFCHVYRKRVLVVDLPKNEEENDDDWDWNHSSLRYIKEAQSWSAEEKHQFFEEQPLPGKLGPIYEDWHKQASHSEASILRRLGFTLYWIPDSHPHKFILYFCQALGLTQSEFTQRAWNYCNDSYRLDLCTRFPPEVIAASVIVSTAHDFSLELPMSPRPWWEAFVGNKDVGETDVVTAANTIVGLSNLDKVSDCDARMDFIIASRGYVQSCIVGSEGSFLDSASPGRPASFIWEHLADSVSRMSLSRCDG